MNEKILYSLESLPFFTKSALMVREEIDPKALYENIQRWVKKGSLIRLKNGLYVTKTCVDRSLRDERYLELVANKLVIPSYVSLEYVLQKHGLLTEATFAVTSVTTKTTRQYTNKLGAFTYSTLNQDLYFGFKRQSYGKNTIDTAEPFKALFDYFYLRLQHLDPERGETVEEARINWSNLEKKEFRNFCKIVEKKGTRKMVKMIPLLKEAHGHSA